MVWVWERHDHQDTREHMEKRCAEIMEDSSTTGRSWMWQPETERGGEKRYVAYYMKGVTRFIPCKPIKLCVNVKLNKATTTCKI